MAINGQIVDEINGLIASRDSIRTTMKAAGIASDTSKLADLATSLAAVKLPGATYTIAASDSVTIPKGKLTTGDQKITAKSLASQTPGDAVAGDILSGKIAWVGGAKVTGNIPTVTPSTTKIDCGKSASISKGYLASDVTITANSLASQTQGNAAAEDIRSGKTAWVGGTQLTGTMPNATITSGSATISSATYTYNSTNGNFSVTGSANVSAPSVGTAGYISSSAGTRNANTATLSATVAKIAGSTSISGTTAMTPTISRQSFTGATDAAAGDAQTSAPSSGVWVKVNSAAKSTKLTATPSVTTAGYGTSSYHGIGGASATVSLSGADVYIPIKTGGVSANNLGTLTKQPSISKQSISISNVTDAAAAGNAQTSAPTSGVWVKVKSAANTASYTPTATKTEGWVSGGQVSGTAGTYGASESADTYIPIKTGDYSASVSTSAGSASMSASGVSTTTSSNCYITLSTTAGSATGKATVGTAGWIAADSKSSSTSVSVSGNGDRLYLATYTPPTITVTNSSQTLSTNGKVCAGNITIPAVNYYYTSLEGPTSTSGYNDGDIWLVVNPNV